MAANVNAAMDALGARLLTISGLRVFDYPPDTLPVPAAVVAYPTVTYDSVFARGADMLSFEVSVIVGRVEQRSARDALGTFLAGTGATSVKTAIDGNLGGAAHSARVASADVRTFSFNGIDYLGAVFVVEVIQ